MNSNFINEISTTYARCLARELLQPVFEVEQGNKDIIVPDEKRLIWEKTVADIYADGIKDGAKFRAPLCYDQENYGDLLIAFSALQWCIIEFKKDFPSRMSEKKKYFYTNPSEFQFTDSSSSVESKGINANEMFLSIVESIQNLEKKRGDNEKREPHFLVYAPSPGKEVRSHKDLLAQFYWGDWSKCLNDIEIKVEDIPQACSSYEDFTKYAGCVRLAKSGDFAIEQDDEGGGYLADLSLVVGINSGNEISHLSTLNDFLVMQRLIATPKKSLVRRLSPGPGG